MASTESEPVSRQDLRTDDLRGVTTNLDFDFEITGVTHVHCNISVECS